MRNVEAAYFDDNYKITPKLTISLGLRYELTPPWFNSLGQEFAPNLNNSPNYPSPNQPADKPALLGPPGKLQQCISGS